MPQKANIRQQKSWESYVTNVRKNVIPAVNKLVVTAGIATDMQKEINALNLDFKIITDRDSENFRQFEVRKQILDSQIQGVIAEQYGLQFKNGDFNIVARPGISDDIYAKDIYPKEDISLGLHPAIIVAGIAAVTLLINSSEQTSQLEHKAKIEQVRLQKKMIEVDKAVLQLGGDPVDIWKGWKKEYFTALREIPASEPARGLIDMLLGKEGTKTALLALGGLGGLYLALKFFSRKSSGIEF